MTRFPQTNDSPDPLEHPVIQLLRNAVKAGEAPRLEAFADLLPQDILSAPFYSLEIPQPDSEDETLNPPNPLHTSIFGHFMARDACIAEFGFSIPARDAVRAIAEYGPVLEVMAGKALWSTFLARLIDVIATEIAPDPRAHFPVKASDAVEAARAHIDRTVFMSWPPMDNTAFQVAQAMIPGQILCHVGELGGCTGDYQFADYLDTDFTALRSIRIPQWPGIHDRLAIFRKNPPP